MGRAWKKDRFRVPYLRNTLWDIGYAVDTLETAVKWDKVTPIMQSIEKTLSNGLAQWNEKVHVFSHLSSVYPTGSSIYTTFVFRVAGTPHETLARWKILKDAASHAIVTAGGTISHQHGVGIDHKPYLEAEKGAIGVSTIKQICSHIDPDQRMNPTKLV
jgi:alkyldihydroxyacetonephosphate synthase